MSEPIQSIAQNNYILSNMAAADLYVQSPLTTGMSGTSAYIGIEPSAQYNETVLWEGNNVKPSLTAIVTSEDMTKFDSIKFYWSTANWLGELVDEVQVTSATTGIQLIHCTGSSNLWLQFVGLNIASDHKSITLAWGKNMNFGSVTGTSWSNPSITIGAGDSFDLSKIVGINRKQ